MGAALLHWVLDQLRHEEPFAGAELGGGCRAGRGAGWAMASAGQQGGDPWTLKVAEVRTRGEDSHGEWCHRW